MAHRITSYHRGPTTAAVTACLCITSRALHTCQFLQIPYLLKYITRAKSQLQSYTYTRLEFRIFLIFHY